MIRLLTIVNSSRRLFNMTNAQRKLIESLIALGGTGTRTAAGRPASVTTLNICIANGWIEALPFDPEDENKYRVTGGYAAVGAPAPRKCPAPPRSVADFF